MITNDLNYFNLEVTTNETMMKLVEKLYNKDPDKFVLLEIGANDGYMCDRMYDFVLKNDPKAIMVEPIPCYVEDLKKNYSHLKNVIFEQVAIDGESGTRQMVYIPGQRFENEEVKFRMTDTEHLEYTPHLLKEHWARGLGSFYDHKNNLACPELSQYTETIEVKTTTIKTLLKKHGITSEHNLIIQTDCEGHDLEILKSFEFSNVRPQMYICEICSMEKHPPSHPAYKPLRVFYGQVPIQTSKQDNKAWISPMFGSPQGPPELFERPVLANYKIQILEYPHEGSVYSIEEEKEAIDIFMKNGYKVFHGKDMFAVDREITKRLNA